MATKEIKNYPETPESGQFMRSILFDMDSRLRVACAIEKDETQASIGVFQILKRRGRPEGPPPTISDGWGGIDQAMIEVYGLVPEYSGCGRPPTRKKAGADWLYLQMVKQRDHHDHFAGTKLKAIFGNLEELIGLLGEVTAYIEQSNSTSRLFNGRQTRTSSRCPSGRPLRFPKTSHVVEQPPLGKTVTTILSNRTRACACEFRMFQNANGIHERLRWLLNFQIMLGLLGTAFYHPFEVLTALERETTGILKVPELAYLYME